MSSPIQKEHELICPCGCGCVVKVIEEAPNQEIPKNPVISFNQFLLGSALVKNVKYAQPRSDRQVNEENVLRRLLSTCTEFDLPERFAFETLRHLQRKNRGFRSESEPIKQLLKILSKDENYLHINKMRAIKARYAEILRK